MKFDYEKPRVTNGETFSDNEFESLVQLKQNLIDTLEQYKALLDMQLLLKK